MCVSPDLGDTGCKGTAEGLAEEGASCQVTTLAPMIVSGPAGAPEAGDVGLGKEECLTTDADGPAVS